LKLFFQTWNFTFTIIIYLKYKIDHYSTGLKIWTCIMVGNKNCDVLLKWNRAQATFTAQRPMLNTWVVHTGFMVDRVAGFLWVTSFLSCHHSIIVPYLTVIMCWLSRPTWGCSMKELSHPTPTIKRQVLEIFLWI
jgi:hypothetical protein